jgi:hypothetical protein
MRSAIDLEICSALIRKGIDGRKALREGMPGGTFNHPDERSARRPPIDYDSNMRKINEHGNTKCPECGHSGWCHGVHGCSAFRSDTPQHTEVIGETTVSIVDIPADAHIKDYYCGCKSELCKSNYEIIYGGKESAVTP